MVLTGKFPVHKSHAILVKVIVSSADNSNVFQMGFNMQTFSLDRASLEHLYCGRHGYLWTLKVCRVTSISFLSNQGALGEWGESSEPTGIALGLAMVLCTSRPGVGTQTWLC